MRDERHELVLQAVELTLAGDIPEGVEPAKVATLAVVTAAVLTSRSRTSG
jgi:hypothetical protein